MIVDVQNSYRHEIINEIGEIEEVSKQKLVAMIKISQHVFYGTADKELACIWGLVAPTILSDQAYLWLYCTPVIDNHKFLFIRHSQRWVEKTLKEYPKIVGYCDEGNVRAIRWIKWLGGIFAAPVNGKCAFEITRKLHG